MHFKVQNLLPTALAFFWHFSVLNLAFSGHWHLATLTQRSSQISSQLSSQEEKERKKRKKQARKRGIRD
jgi:hypothetical protein